MIYEHPGKSLEVSAMEAAFQRQRAQMQQLTSWWQRGNLCFGADIAIGNSAAVQAVLRLLLLIH